MKKLFYFLFLTSFLITSCSDDDKEYFTRDVEYDVYARVTETTYPTLQNGIYISTNGGDWYIEGYNYNPKLTYSTSVGTLHIHCGELEYTKNHGGCYDYSRTYVPPGDLNWVIEPQVILPNDVSKIVIMRKGAQDTYNVERSGNLITIAPLQTSFSKFGEYKYQTRAENTFAVRFPYGNNELYDQFFEFISSTIPITVYEYDSSIHPLWKMMWYYDISSALPLYRYENESDNKKIVRLFDEFCDEIAKDKTNFYARFEDWTGKRFEYPIY